MPDLSLLVHCIAARRLTPFTAKKENINNGIYNKGAILLLYGTLVAIVCIR